MKKLLIVLAVLVVAALFYRQHRELRNYKDTAQLQAVELSMFKNSVKVIQEKNGDLNFQVQAVQVEKRNLKESLELAGFKIKDLKEKEIRWRKLNSVLQAKLEASDSGQTVIRDTFLIVENDTVRAGSFQVNNNYLLFNGLIKKDSLDWDYRYNVEFDFFQQKIKNETLVTVALNDPNAEITSMNGITISHKKKFYERPIVWAVAGLATGIIISK
jgi:hypothetical protein